MKDYQSKSPYHRPKNPLVHAAQLAYQNGEYPREVYQAYRGQADVASRRGIDFRFTIKDWWNWWQIDGRWHHRGVGRGKLVMARNGDTGPYHPSNVRCITHTANIEEIDWAPSAAKQKARWAAKTPEERAQWHLAVRGDGHPKSRAVLTPQGRFGSAALAADAHGITRQYASLLARTCTKGWRYEHPAALRLTPRLPVAPRHKPFDGDVHADNQSLIAL